MIKSIFICDDSDVLRATLRMFIERNDQYCVIGEADNGKDAVRQTKDLHPDLIILDLAMPGMNGIQTARRLKTQSPLTPILLFTNVDSDRLTDIALASGVDAVISKSNPTDLLDQICTLLPI